MLSFFGIFHRDNALFTSQDLLKTLEKEDKLNLLISTLKSGMDTLGGQQGSLVHQPLSTHDSNL